VLEQPTSIPRFAAATFSWRGGSTAVDNPVVRVERRQGQRWVPYASQSGEVPTMVALPAGAPGFVEAWTGSHEWRWTASFEAFSAFPATVVPGGQVPAGDYRFVVDGVVRGAAGEAPYHLESAAFTVVPWGGVTADDVRVEGGAVSFAARSSYPRTYESPFPYVADDGGTVLCRTCSFRPWASGAEVVSAAVTVGTRTVPASAVDGRWTVPLRPGQSAVIPAGGLRDAFGETNAAPITLVEPR
jgi:hypothetical protein